jgi:glycosyltransferase involved in cell wall biosynthesis
VVVTEAFRQNLIKRNVPPEKVFTIPNGADVEFWQPSEPSAALRKELGLTEDSFVVLYIGAHGISQELASVLKSARQLQQHRQIQFVFVGEGAKKEELVQQCREMGLDNVRFLDSVAKQSVKDFYALADVCLVPLRKIPLFETFIPSKMFEIMAMARPIVGSLAGEAADILRKSGGAKVVQPEDHEAMAGAILNLYQNRDKAREMGRRGRDFVIQNYSRHTLAAAYSEVINEAVSEYQSKR